MELSDLFQVDGEHGSSNISGCQRHMSKSNTTSFGTAIAVLLKRNSNNSTLFDHRTTGLVLSKSPRQCGARWPSGWPTQSSRLHWRQRHKNKSKPHSLRLRRRLPPPHCGSSGSPAGPGVSVLRVRRPGPGRRAGQAYQAKGRTDNVTRNQYGTDALCLNPGL